MTSRPASAPRRRTSTRRKQFVDDYKAAGFSEPFSAYGVLTYDAANVIINGLAKASLTAARSTTRSARR